jgi:hypothetical protein
VIEGNTLNWSVAGIEVNSLTSQTVLASNSFNNVGTVKVDGTVSGASHASVGTVIAGSAAPKIPVTLNVWNQVTIGSLAASQLPSEPASVTSFSLGTSLYQFGGTSDSFSMLAQQESSDITAIARITMPSGESSAAQGLVTFRDSSSPSGAFVSVGVLQNGYVTFQYRCWDGAGVQGYTFPVQMSPVWVKLIKSGNLFQAYVASDGLSWQYAGEIGLAFASSNYLVGLEGLSNTVSGPAIVFDNVSLP